MPKINLYHKDFTNPPIGFMDLADRSTLDWFIQLAKYILEHESLKKEDIHLSEDFYTETEAEKKDLNCKFYFSDVTGIDENSGDEKIALKKYYKRKADCHEYRLCEWEEVSKE